MLHHLPLPLAARPLARGSPLVGGAARGAVVPSRPAPGVLTRRSACPAPRRPAVGGASMAGCRRLSGAGLREVLGPAQGVLFDCDGVLWAGERAVPGAPELLERLRRSGKAAFFVSNNSRRSVAELERRFARLGFRGVRAEHIFSSALCSALLLRQRLLGAAAGAAGDAGPGRVFVLGGEGLRGELRAAGLRLAGEEEEEAAVRAVLVGYDDQFTFAKLAQACAYLRDPRCLLVATDPDPWHPLSNGQRTPGEGPRGVGRGGPLAASVAAPPPCACRWTSIPALTCYTGALPAGRSPSHPPGLGLPPHARVHLQPTHRHLPYMPHMAPLHTLLHAHTPIPAPVMCIP